MGSASRSSKGRWVRPARALACALHARAFLLPRRATSNKMSHPFGRDGVALRGHRGSRKRLRHLKLGEKRSVALWALVASVLLLLLAAVPWLLYPEK